MKQQTSVRITVKSSIGSTSLNARRAIKEWASDDFQSVLLLTNRQRMPFIVIMRRHIFEKVTWTKTNTLKLHPISDVYDFYSSVVANAQKYSAIGLTWNSYIEAVMLTYARYKELNISDGDVLPGEAVEEIPPPDLGAYLYSPEWEMYYQLHRKYRRQESLKREDFAKALALLLQSTEYMVLRNKLLHNPPETEHKQLTAAILKLRYELWKPHFGIT